MINKKIASIDFETGSIRTKVWGCLNIGVNIGSLYYSTFIGFYNSDNHRRNFLECVRDCKVTNTPIEVAHRSISVGLLGEIAMNTKM